MCYDTDGEHPFDTDNRAWRRFGDVISEHLDAATWTRDRDGRPVLVTLRDVQTGDMVTLAVLDSLEAREPHVLLAVDTDDHLAAHGPTGGADTAASYAGALALHTVTLASTRPTPLHDPATTALPTTAWVDVPPKLAAALRPALDDASAAVLVLLDRAASRIAVIGPFPTHTAADTWHPDNGPDRSADRLVVPLHPISLQDAPS